MQVWARKLKESERERREAETERKRKRAGEKGSENGMWEEWRMDEEGGRQKEKIQTYPKCAISELFQDLKKRDSHICDMQALQPLPAPTNTANTVPTMTTSGGQPPLPVSETVWITTITRTDHDRPCARCASHALPHHHSPIKLTAVLLHTCACWTTADYGRSNGEPSSFTNL